MYSPCDALFLRKSATSLAHCVICPCSTANGQCVARNVSRACLCFFSKRFTQNDQSTHKSPSLVLRRLMMRLTLLSMKRLICKSCSWQGCCRSDNLRKAAQHPLLHALTSHQF